jgi:isoquinoline 1-oxidoreductase subunit beta
VESPGIRGERIEQRDHATRRPAAPQTYGKVAEAAATPAPSKEVKLKDANDWKIAGKPLTRLDTMEKLTGKPLYGYR